MRDEHIQIHSPSADVVEMMALRIRAYISPNSPRNAAQTLAFNKAVEYQIAHEMTLEAKCGDDAMPDGVTSFAIGDFSMSFDKDAISSVITNKSICPYAYSVLLESGLLYKGVGGRL